MTGPVTGSVAGRAAGSVAVTAALAAGAATVVGAVVRWVSPTALDRTAHVGRSVTLAAGPATATGLLLAVAVEGPRSALPAIAAAAAAGLVDDLAGTGSGAPPGSGEPRGTRAERAGVGRAGTPRGLAGHLGALSAGRVTTGSLKVGVIGVGAVATAALLAGSAPPRQGAVPPRGPAPDPARVGVWRVLADGAVIAGTANLVNLLDLRPGRAGKATGTATLVVLASIAVPTVAGGTVAVGVRGVADGARLAAAVLGAVAADLPRDLAGEWMLGDCGANALGAALGASVVAGSHPRVRTGWLVVVLVLTALSERVSFSAVIDRTPALAWWDRLGRPATRSDTASDTDTDPASAAAAAGGPR